uniref:Uncharacterized protein n=1 Tax=Arundo donax TaxID=35708 RepID=A0A0A9FWL0_ARUDO
MIQMNYKIKNLHNVDWRWTPKLVTNQAAGLVRQACKPS